MVRTKRTFPGETPKAKKSGQKAAVKRSFIQGVPQYVRARQPELKNEDLSLGTTLTADTLYIGGTVQGITEGAGDNERVGRKISLVSYRCKLTFNFTPGATTYPPVIRVMLILDRSPNGAGTPTATQMLTSDNINALMNLDNDSRFKNLFDRTFTLASGGGSDHFAGELDVYVPLRGLVTKFLANTGAATDVAENNMAICVISTHAVTFAGLQRTRYFDA